MNVLLNVHPPPDAARIAHSVMAYDRATDELSLEHPIPLFLDTLALKIAGVPPEDKFGADSYKLDASAVNTFRFLIGIDNDLSARDYFLESTAGLATSFAPRKLQAVELLTQLTPRPRYARTGKPSIAERELVLPTLRLLDDAAAGWLAISDIVARMTALFPPSDQDAATLPGRRDTYFTQKIRSMIAHRNQPSSFIHKGLARYEEHGLRISDAGRATVHALLR